MALLLYLDDAPSPYPALAVRCNLPCMSFLSWFQQCSGDYSLWELQSSSLSFQATKACTDSPAWVTRGNYLGAVTLLLGPESQ